MTSVQRRGRVRAPELVGRGWLNTAGTAYSIKDFRGRFVLLDFWTFCCINCLHVLDELRSLEGDFAAELITVGVHSPKFVHEADATALAAAVERYAVHHPVLDDPELVTWQAYAVKAWPTLVLVDPEGYLVHVAAGEGHVDALRRILGELVAEHRAKGTLQPGDGPYVPPPAPATELRFPGKAVALGDTVLVADTAHHRLVELAGDSEGDTAGVVRRIGSGLRGRADGAPDTASFAEPGGLALLPETVAAQVGYDLVVADTVNHLLRGVHLASGRVRTVAGTGAQWRDGPDGGPARAVDLTSPWDVAWWEPAGGVVIAMAGNHTLGLFDPVAETVRRFAGTTVEGLRDGALDTAFFAQPSGLAATPDRLWLADAETSALRWIEAVAPAATAAGGGEFQVRTAVGAGLFDFGHRDGPGASALLQHPLGVSALPDGSVLVADTYNGALRRYDPGTREMSTLAAELAEPADVLVVGGEVVVLASAAHRLERPVPPGVAATLVSGDAQQVRRPATEIGPGEVELVVVFSPPPGLKLDDRYGPSTRLEVTASPADLLAEGAGVGTDLVRRLVLNPDAGGGVLHVVAQGAACDADPAVEHPACRLVRQDWGVPVRVVADGPDRLPLVLGGLDE